MYYDARPSGFNGIFASFGEVFKTYYTFLAAKEVIKNKNALKVESDSGTYAMASTQNTESAMMLTFFEDDETTAPDTLKVSVTGAKTGEATIATVYKLNRELDLEPIREEIFTSSDFSLYLKAENYDVYMIKFKEYK